MSKIYFIIIFSILQLNLIANAQTKDIQCSLFSAFEKYEGAFAFSLDDKKKEFKLWGLKSEGSLVTLDQRGGWLHEIKGKVFPYAKNNKDYIQINTTGQYNWQFFIDRQNGAVKVEAKNMIVYSAFAKCRIIDNKPKF